MGGYNLSRNLQGRVRPAAPSIIDYSSPAANGLVFALFSSGYNMRSETAGAPLVSEGTRAGTGYILNGPEVLSFGRPGSFDTARGTIITGFTPAGGSDPFAKVFVTTDNNFQLYRDNGGSSLNLKIDNVSSGALSPGDDVFSASATEKLLAATWDESASERRVWTFNQDGQTSATSFTSNNSDTSDFHFLNRADGARQVNARLRFLLVFNRVLTDVEIHSLQINPYQLLRPAANNQHYVQQGIARSITDIDGDNSVAVGQTSVTITCAGLDSAPTVQTATLDGEALTITDWNSGSPIVTIPVDIALKWGRTDLQLAVTDDTGTVTLNDITLSAEAGWEYVNFSGTAPSAGTESGYELVQADHSYALLAGDQWIFESETGLSYDVDTLPTVNPPATITSEYRYWNDSAATMSAKTAYTIAQKPTLTLGSFTAG